MSLEKLARQWTAVCIHSKHQSSGCRTALDLTCRYGTSDGRVYAFPPGGGSAFLICPTCPHYDDGRKR